MCARWVEAYLLKLEQCAPDVVAQELGRVGVGAAVVGDAGRDLADQRRHDHLVLLRHLEGAEERGAREIERL